MNHDEFAFFNQQLAAMLREGIPLEGALKQLSKGMRHGPLQTEIARLEADLGTGRSKRRSTGAPCRSFTGAWSRSAPPAMIFPAC
jgi:type II secretory pathway component PulF